MSNLCGKFTGLRFTMAQASINDALSAAEEESRSVGSRSSTTKTGDKTSHVHRRS